MPPDLSVVIPLYNESPNLRQLHAELTATLEAWGRPYEIVAVDDGSRDDSFQILSELHAADPRLHVIRFRRNFGQTAAMNAGIALVPADRAVWGAIAQRYVSAHGLSRDGGRATVPVRS